MCVYLRDGLYQQLELDVASGTHVPGASSWGDWDPGTAAGQPAAVPEPSCWRHPH